MAKKSAKRKKQELIETDSVLSSESYTRKIRRIIEFFKEGLTDKEILIKILQENPNIKESSANTYLRAAKASFREEFIIERKFNIIQHIKRYDKDILALSRYEPKTSSYSKYQFDKSEAYLNMVDLLQKKERVLGFHRKTTQIKIKNNIQIKLEPVKKTFDFSDLSWEEKLELFKYVNKAKINENENLKLLPNQKKLLRGDESEEVIIDTSKNEEVLNIEYITEKNEPPPSLDAFEKEDVISSKNIIDATPKANTEKKNLEDITKTLLGIKT